MWLQNSYKFSQKIVLVLVVLLFQSSNEYQISNYINILPHYSFNGQNIKDVFVLLDNSILLK